MVNRTLRLPEKLYKKIKEIAKERGVTCNALIVSVLWEFLDNNE